LIDLSGVISGQGKIVRAVQNLRYLLNQGYPRESAVNFVANHYRFPLNQRHLLARCVFSKLEVAKHRRKSVRASAVRGKRLGIDGYKKASSPANKSYDATMATSETCVRFSASIAYLLRPRERLRSFCGLSLEQSQVTSISCSTNK